MPSFTDRLAEILSTKYSEVHAMAVSHWILAIMTDPDIGPDFFDLLSEWEDHLASN